LSDPVGFVRGLDRVTIDEVQRGPEVLRAIQVSVDEDRRQAWTRDYLKTLQHRDMGDIAQVEKQEAMNRLFRILAHHSAQLVNYSQLGARWVWMTRRLADTA